jgi:hypothetical protein
VEGAVERAYVAPLSLLAASLLLPRSEHPRLLELANGALVGLRDSKVIAELETVVSESIKPWPDPAKAHEALRRATAAMPDVERLSLDVAAAGAFDA